MTTRYDPDEAREALDAWLVRDEGDETRAFCPLCEEPGASISPSASLNFGENKWNCLKTETDGGSISRLLKTLRDRESGDNVRPIRRDVSGTVERTAFPYTEDELEAWHEALLANQSLVDEVEGQRGWSRATLINFMVGHHRGRFTIPIYDENDQLVNVRQYKPNPGDQQKFINVKGHGDNRLWGFDTLRNSDTILLCAGEPDRILAVQEGFPAVTWTGGEGNFKEEWAPHFEGKIVYICLDADDTGRKAALKIVGMLERHAGALYVVTIPEKHKGYDVTDVIMNEGPKALDQLIQDAEFIERPDDNPITETDHGNALRLIDAHTEDFRHIADMKRWHSWDKTRWAADINDRIIRRAHIDLAHQLPEGGFKRVSLSSPGITSCIRVAEVDRRISILARELDAHPELLNTPVGPMDLRSGDLQPFDPELLLSKSTAYPVDMGGKHPMWDRFLGETFMASEELIPYMQRLAGLALYGGSPERILPFLHGTGANGKSVFTLVLQGLLGDADNGGYAVSQQDGFLTSSSGNMETAIARLRGARFVICAEQSSGQKFNEARIKKFTGGERLTGRHLYGHAFDFDPSHLLWVMSNHLPGVKEGGPSFWGRVRMIPFNNVVPDDKVIKELHLKLLASEGPAILGWFVRGAMEVLANGLQDPAAVTKATREYQMSEDTLASFLDDQCEQAPDLKVKVPDFVARLRQYCEELDVEAISTKTVTQRLTTEFGIESGRNGSSRLYKGVALSGKLTASSQS